MRRSDRVKGNRLHSEATSNRKKVMETKLLETMFGRMGARVKVRHVRPPRERAGVDIRIDDRGEYFDIGVSRVEPIKYQVIDVRPEARHLLLMARTNEEKQKFLCGHDERHWFVCAVPGASVSNVKAAMEALQPQEVRTSVQRRVKRIKNRLKRRNEAFVRQGEWFFIPAPDMTINEKLIRKTNRSAAAGVASRTCVSTCTVMAERWSMSSQAPEWRHCGRVPAATVGEPRRSNLELDHAVRDANVYVCGRVSHVDHKTVVLNGWHRCDEHRASCAGSPSGCFPGLAKVSRAVTSYLAKFAVLTTRS